MDAFHNRNPVDSKFWDERFHRGFTPWDQGGVPQALRDFVSRSERPLTCLIPGCGAAYEAAYLSEAGWGVTAIDFSEEAVSRAKASLGQWADRAVHVDFFAYQPEQALDIIYERAFLCALPPAMRDEIARRWAELLPSGALLAGFFFFDAAPKGPPFGISMRELYDLLTPRFELMVDDAVQDSIPVFAGKERWQIWRRR